jgi:hypothetical protein
VKPIDVRCALYCATEVVRSRQRTGQPIPQWLREHHQRLDTAVRGFAPRGQPVGVIADSAQQSQHEAVVGSAQVARMLDLPCREVRRRAEQLGAVMVAGRWLFSRENVVNYMQGGTDA